MTDPSGHGACTAAGTAALDLHAIGARLAGATGDRAWATPTATLISGGKSNLTYELCSPAGRLVLRRPPTGAILPSAHDMAREVRVQRALRGGPVPVPGIVLFDESGEDLGVPYYVMEKIAGHVVRDAFPPGYAAAAEDRRLIAHALVDALGSLHGVEPGSVGLEGFGRPAGFMHRQLARWTDQWERSRTRAVAEVDALGGALATIAFPEVAGSIVHGDYRLDNCLLGEDLAEPIAAVLDWELSTLGDPLADLGMLLFYWCQRGEPAPLLTPAITATSGFPSRSEVVGCYVDATGAPVELLPAYVAFAHFKFAVIAQGIARRSRAGAMAGQDFGDLGAEVERIAAQGLERLKNREI